TATVRAVDNGEQQIIATVDGKDFTIIEASVRRHLQLRDADSISVLPKTKIFNQLSLMGYISTNEKLTFQKDESVYKEWDDSVERAITTASLDAAQHSGGSPKCQETTRDPLLRLGLRGQGSSLGDRLKVDKEVYGTDYTKLVMKVKKLEKTVKSNQARRRTKDNTYTRRRRAVSTGSEGISTASKIFSTDEESVSNAGESMPVSTADVVQEGVKDKGKAIMQDSEQPKKIKKRVQIHISLDEELAQELYEEEQARFNAEQEAKFNVEQK
nr:hypothetical protein [Tanacetum cinerariifolium]